MQYPHNSAAFRTNLTQLISPLRRVRPRVPFYKLASHQIPTLWSLYRGLLREAPAEPIQFRIRMLFRQNQHLTGTAMTKKALLQGYKFLDAFKRANAGDQKLQAILRRYSQLLAAKIEKEHWKHLVREEVAWQTKLRNRPILTGGYFRPSNFNKPLPRLKPQPLAITRMVGKRRKAKEKRLMRFAQLQESLNDLRIERQFEQGLAKLVGPTVQFTPIYSDSFGDWVGPVKEARGELFDAFQHSNDMARMTYTPEMLESIKQARRDKIANKTKEVERERRGEILRRTILRQRKGPPAHILSKMTPEQRKMDKIVRNVSEVGYVAQLKRKLGFKLQDPHAWKKELGSIDEKERLDKMMEEINKENERRRVGSLDT